jgi:hypothetical protein
MDYVKMAILAAVFIAGLGIGGTTTYKLEHGKVLAMQLAITKANARADAQKLKIETATKDARKLNTELDKSHEAAINSLNSAHDELNATIKRLLSGKAVDNLSTGTNIGGDPKNSASGTIFSEKLKQTIAEFLPSEALRADKIAVEHNTMLEFIKNNCGIAR